MVLSSIYESVKSVKNKYGTNDPYEICDEEDILVYSAPLVGSVDGFLDYDDESDTFMICLKESLSFEEQTITLAHELAHYYLHSSECVTYLRHNTIQFDSEYEKDADVFASELLLDDDIFNDNLGLSSYEIACLKKVPEKFIMLKYKKLFKISY